MGRRRTCRRNAFTLLEVVLALGLMTLVTGMLFAFYHTAMQGREQGRKAITEGQLARMIAQKIADEVHSANGFLAGSGVDRLPGIFGDDRMITLQTVVLPDKSIYQTRGITDDPPPGQCDIRQVSYYLAYDLDVTDFVYPGEIAGPAPMGLVRRQVKTLFQAKLREDKADSVELDLFCSEMKYLRFRYFDGVEWLDKWDLGRSPEGSLGNALPQAVEITVGYTPLPPKEELEEEELGESELIPSEPEPFSPQTVSVVVRLPQADTFFGSRLMRAQKGSRERASQDGGG